MKPNYRIYLAPELLTLLKELARARHTSMAGVIRQLILEAAK